SAPRSRNGRRWSGMRRYRSNEAGARHARDRRAARSAKRQVGLRDHRRGPPDHARERARLRIGGGGEGRGARLDGADAAALTRPIGLVTRNARIRAGKATQTRQAKGTMKNEQMLPGQVVLVLQGGG